MLVRLKAWAWAIAAGALAVIGLLVRSRILQQQRDNARVERDKYKHQAKQSEKVAEELSEANQTFSYRATLREEEKRNEPAKVPDRLRDNNDF